MVVVWLALLAVSAPPAPPDVLVTAAAPINAERLADALRSYLVDHGIRVETASAAAGADLRRQLGEARRMGEAVRAVAVVRAEAGAPGSIEIELVDLATQKALITTVPRPPRDEDLYRALALKIQALLRSTLSEAPERLAPGSRVARLAAPVDEGVAEASRADASSARLSLETGYAALSFPLGGLFFQGVSVAGRFTATPWLDVGLGLAALGSTRSEDGDVVVDTTLVPVTAAARLRFTRARVELLAGPTAEVATVRASSSSATTPVHASRDLLVAAGAELEGRLRVGSAAWVYLRASALGVLVGPDYVVQGRAIADTTRFQVGVAAGMGIGMP